MTINDQIRDEKLQYDNNIIFKNINILLVKIYQNLLILFWEKLLKNKLKVKVKSRLML